MIYRLFLSDIPPGGLMEIADYARRVNKSLVYRPDYKNGYLFHCTDERLIYVNNNPPKEHEKQNFVDYNTFLNIIDPISLFPI